MKNKNFLKKLTAGILGFVMTLGVGAAGYAAGSNEAKAAEQSVTFDLSSATNRTKCSTNLIQYDSGNTYLKIIKGTGTNANNYCPTANSHTRVYNNNSMEFGVGNGYVITKLEITATGSSYTGGLSAAANYSPSATISTSGTYIMTVSFDSATRSSTVTANTTGTGRLTAVKIYYDVGSSKCSVTYDANNSTGGTVPTDSTSYDSGASVTVLGNTGGLYRTGYTFGGWNTKADGEGTTYSAGETFNISSNTTLYAKWNEIVTEYQLVTSSQTDWSGSYLIAWVSGNTASVWNGAMSSATVSATISNNKIAKPSGAAVAVVEAITNGYSIKLTGGSKDKNYVGLTSSSSTITYSTTDPILNTFSNFSTSAHTVNITSNGKILTKNDNNIKYYATSGGYAKPCLFKLVQQATQLNAPTNPNVGVDDTTVTFSWTGSEHADGYNLSYKKTSDSSFTTVQCTTNSYENTFEPGTYEAKVTATSTDSAYSESQPCIFTGGFTVNEPTYTYSFESLKIYSSKDNQSGKTVYYEGNSFDKTNWSVILTEKCSDTSKDNRTTEVAGSSTFINFDSSSFESGEERTCNIQAKYTYNGTEYTTSNSVAVTVYKLKATKLEITGAPTEVLNNDDLARPTSIIAKTFNDPNKTQQDVTSTASITGYNKSVWGSQTITVSYLGATETFSVTHYATKDSTITDTIDSFTSTSGDIGDNARYTSYKGDGSTNPDVSNGQLKLYRKNSSASDTTQGSYVVIEAKNSKIITKVSITFGSNGHGKTKVDNGSYGTVFSFVTDETKDFSNLSCSKFTYSVTGSAQVYIKAISVSYGSIIKYIPGTPLSSDDDLTLTSSSGSPISECTSTDIKVEYPDNVTEEVNLFDVTDDGSTKLTTSNPISSEGKKSFTYTFTPDMLPEGVTTKTFTFKAIGFESEVYKTINIVVNVFQFNKFDISIEDEPELLFVDHTYYLETNESYATLPQDYKAYFEWSASNNVVTLEDETDEEEDWTGRSIMTTNTVGTSTVTYTLTNDNDNIIGSATREITVSAHKVTKASIDWSTDTSTYAPNHQYYQGGTTTKGGNGTIRTDAFKVSGFDGRDSDFVVVNGEQTGKTITGQTYKFEGYHVTGGVDDQTPAFTLTPGDTLGATGSSVNFGTSYATGEYHIYVLFKDGDSWIKSSNSVTITISEDTYSGVVDFVVAPLSEAYSCFNTWGDVINDYTTKWYKGSGASDQQVDRYYRIYKGSTLVYESESEDNTFALTDIITEEQSGDYSLKIWRTKTEYNSEATLSKTHEFTVYELSGIVLSGQTTEFYNTQDFEFNGTVTASYKDTETKKVITNYSVSEVDMSLEGEQRVTVTVGSQSRSYFIYITLVAVQSISVEGQTTTFECGDTFEFDGTVRAHYSATMSSPITSGYTVSGPTTEQMQYAGTYTVTVSYPNVESVTYNITVSVPSGTTVDTIKDSDPGYKLVTDASTLKAGDKIILACSSVSAVNSVFDTKYLGSAQGTFKDGFVTLGTGAQVLTLGGESGAWTLSYVNSSGTTLTIYTKNGGDFSTTATGNTGTFTIEIDESGNATIASTNSANGKILYNSTSPRFKGYTSGPSASMLLPEIYRYTSGEPIHVPQDVSSDLYNACVASQSIIDSGEMTTEKWDLIFDEFAELGQSDLTLAQEGCAKADGNIVEIFLSEYDSFISLGYDNFLERVVKNVVTFDSNGGTAVPSQTLEIGQKVTKPADPTKDDYTFIGWFNGNKLYDFNSDVTGSLTLTAKWSNATYLDTKDMANVEITTGLNFDYKTTGTTVQSVTNVKIRFAAAMNAEALAAYDKDGFTYGMILLKTDELAGQDLNKLFENLGCDIQVLLDQFEYYKSGTWDDMASPNNKTKVPEFGANLKMTDFTPAGLDQSYTCIWYAYDSSTNTYYVAGSCEESLRHILTELLASYEEGSEKYNLINYILTGGVK